MQDASTPLPRLIIRNVRVVTPDEVLPDAAVVVDSGLIREVTAGPVAAAGCEELDGRGRLLLPGFIDIHSDVIENAIQPRPGGRFPVDVALQELDKQLVACWWPAASPPSTTACAFCPATSTRRSEAPR